MIFRKFSIFTAISGLGWFGDFCVFTVLIWSGLDIRVANLLSATAAVHFVFFATRVVLFNDPKRYRSSNYLKYISFHLVAIPLASVAIALIAWALVPLGNIVLGGMAETDVEGTPQRAPELAAIVSKILVTPITLAANFLYISWLLARRVT